MKEDFKFNSEIAAISILVENLKTNVDKAVSSSVKPNEAETLCDVFDKLGDIEDLLGTLYRN